MMQVLKPLAGPAFSILIGAGLELSDMKNELLAGTLIALGIFWGVAALLSNKALLRKYPWLLEWMPFLEQSGRYAASEQLHSSFLRGMHIRIADLAVNNEIEDRSFEDCVIYGPAVMAFSEYCNANECTYSMPSPEYTMSWIMKFEADKTLLSEMPIGAIVVKKCIFKRCKFSGVGFVHTAASAREFDRTLGIIRPEKPKPKRAKTEPESDEPIIPDATDSGPASG